MENKLGFNSGEKEQLYNQLLLFFKENDLSYSQAEIFLDYSIRYLKCTGCLRFPDNELEILNSDKIRKQINAL